MARLALALAGAALAAGGAVSWWALSRGAPEGTRTEAAAEEVARLRAVVEEQAGRIARLEEAVSRSGVPERGRGPPGGPDAPGGVRAGGIDSDAPAASASLERGREVLADLRANADGTREVAIREALRDLVRVGDPIVPEIVALLDSEPEKRYVEGKPLRQHVRGYASLRMVLQDALREIGTPAAKRALLGAAGRSRSVHDFRNLIYPYAYGAAPVPILEEGISALVPDMLRSLAESGIAERDGEAADLAGCLATWIRKRGLTGVVEPLEEVILKQPLDPGVGWMSYQSLFSVFAELAPERAARVFLALTERAPKQRRAGMDLERLGNSVPRSALIRFYAVLLSGGDSTPEQRAAFYWAMPDHALRSIEDPAKRAQDAETFATFLEGRLAVEVDENVRRTIEEKLKKLRKDIEEGPK